MNKKTLLFCSLCLSISGFSQSYFSTLQEGDNYVTNGGMTQFNNRTIIVANETCNGFTNTECTYLFEAMDDGSLLHLMDVHEMHLFDKSIISNANRLAIVGINENHSLQLFQYDVSLNLTHGSSYPLGDAGNSWIFEMVEFNGYYVITTYNFGTGGENYPSLYWFDVNDLSFEGTYTIEIHEAALKQISIDHNGNLNVFKTVGDQNEILTFDSNMTLIEDIAIQEIGNIPYLNLDITPQGDIIYGLHNRKKLLSYNDQQQLNWEADIALAFDVSEVIMRDLQVVSNGDILLCGSLNKNENEYGFIYLLTNEGIEKWKRLYSIEKGTSKNPLKAFIETENEGYTFYGTARQEPFPSSNNFDDSHWILKTNNNGCIDASCEEETIVNNNDLSLAKMTLYPNPTTSTLSIINNNSIYNQTFTISNLQGSQLIKASLINNEINLSSLESGIYILSIYTNGVLTFTEKTIKI